MKKGIHPEVYRAIVRCNCGAEFETLSTKKELRVDVCIECHPIFGGKQRETWDSEGRIERYYRRYGKK
ncbi:50S ribosomal protein L31 [Candidatus Bipolaricaulota bacterium]|nr:50S ribosomal protein L31 [Candidatus Bipolaricaulota bacterium]